MKNIFGVVQLGNKTKIKTLQFQQIFPQFLTL